MNKTRPLWVQSDGTLLLDENHPEYAETRDLLREIAMLHKRPGAWHTYKLTPVTLWNAAAAGWTAETILQRLAESSGNPLPARIAEDIREKMTRYGRIRLVRESDGALALATDSPELMALLRSWEPVAACFEAEPAGTKAILSASSRGWIKRELAERGYPVRDEAGFHVGRHLDVALRSETAAGKRIALRDYQSEAVDALLRDSAAGGGSGVVVLPCGAGKTWVGMAALARLRCETLILTPNGVSVSQWISELLENTNLTENEVGEYTGQAKNVKPVTVATYQVLTYRRSKLEDYPHMQLFVNRDWGLIIYDEAHLLPAPVFRMTADIQATRRLGLTATLVREDGREGDAFALIGPKCYDVPWKTMEARGWIAQADCTEVRVPLAETVAGEYYAASKSRRNRIAGENPRKTEVVRALLNRHRGAPTLVIGQYLDQLHELANELSLPLVTGEMPLRGRQRLFDRFKQGQIDVLLVSKVANFAVDLPDATIAIQVSGSFGSRQEEAQRLGRILRPKSSGAKALYYSVVSEGTDEVEFSRNRGRFLLEQGYPYTVDRWEDEPAAKEAAP
ncbi:DNA repair helicase XPB [Paenibacillaceae bacterium WGS1546]|uniref:DNA repair helicase XPB n=1 Tax=Cohnella sp. WGS1546 TaxID=3366810 RepID=UPI00372D3F00